MNLFRMPISSVSIKPAGDGVQLTFGTALERFPSVANGRIAFASQSENVDVWFVSGDTNRGGEFSKPVRLTSDLAEDEFPAFAWKAGKVYYLSSRAGDSSLHELELGTQKTSAVAAAEGPKRRLLVTPDASRLVYSAARTLWAVRPGQPAEQVYKGEEAMEYMVPWGLSASGKQVLLGSRLRGEGKLELLDLGTGRARKLLESWTSQATFSPDGRHFVVLREQAISIFPVNDAPLDAGRDAIMVAKASAGQDLPRWSPDGKRIYFLSSRDGFRCIWMQRLNPATLRPEGEPQAAVHLHGSRVSLMHVPDIGAVGLSVGPHGIVYSAGEATGNIWLATPQEER